MQTRSSKPNAVAKDATAVLNDPEDSEYADDDDPDVDNAPKRKRVRKTGKKPTAQEVRKVGGRRGKLRQLPEMPLDLLYDIFGHLHPVDLLHLARTTKALRNIVMRRSAISLWKQALESVNDLPPCPDDLTEAQYACLAFESHCHYCMAPSVHTVLWALRKRSCKKCMDLHIDDLRRLSDLFNLPSRHGALLPYSHTRNRYKPLAFKAEAEQVSQLLEELQPNSTILNEYIAERKAIVEKLVSHGQLCAEWYSNRRGARTEELSAMRRQRKDAVYERLSTLGWDKDLEYLKNNRQHKPLSEHALVKVPKLLTDRVWQNIEGPLIEYLTKIRVERLDCESRERLSHRCKALTTAYQDYVHSRPRNEIIPPLGDVYLMEGLQTFIEDSAPEVEITSSSFTDYLARIPQLSVEWRLAKDRELLAVMAHDGAGCKTEELARFEKEEEFSLLKLAMTLFSCKHCRGVITYPRILAHSCMSAGGYNDGPLNSLPWSVVRLGLTRHKGASDAANTLLQCLGLSPLTTQAQELDELDPWFECLPCNQEKLGRYVCGWRKVVYHASVDWPHSSTSEKPALVLLSDEDKALAKTQLAASTESLRLGSTLKCTRCKDVSYSTVASHMKETHGIDNPSDEDTYVPIDISLCNPTWTIRIPPARDPEVPDQNAVADLGRVET